MRNRRPCLATVALAAGVVLLPAAFADDDPAGLLAARLEGVSTSVLALEALERGDVDVARRILSLSLRVSVDQAATVAPAVESLDQSIPSLRDAVKRAVRFLDDKGMDASRAKVLDQELERLTATQDEE